MMKIFIVNIQGTFDFFFKTIKIDLSFKFKSKGSLNSFGDSLNNSSGTMEIQQDGNKRETLHSRFDFIKVLGKGTYGKVKLANDKRTGKQVCSFNFHFSLLNIKWVIRKKTVHVFLIALLKSNQLSA